MQGIVTRDDIMGELVGAGLHGEEGFAQRSAREREVVPLRRTADPEHVAQAVLGLLGMDMVTGEAVIVDGGKHVVY